MEKQTNGFLYVNPKENSFERAVHLVWAHPKLGEGRTTLDLYLRQGLDCDESTRQLMLNAPPQTNHIASSNGLEQPTAELVYSSTRGTEENPELVKDVESYRLSWALEARGCKILSYTQTPEGNRLIHASPDIKQRIEPFLTRR
ncbi:MAG: hypothetical protein AABX54_05800 [Nanoarchaeota archaeon]